jgi:hypothetical protein
MVKSRKGRERITLIKRELWEKIFVSMDEELLLFMEI